MVRLGSAVSGSYVHCNLAKNTSVKCLSGAARRTYSMLVKKCALYVSAVMWGCVGHSGFLLQKKKEVVSHSVERKVASNMCLRVHWNKMRKWACWLQAAGITLHGRLCCTWGTRAANLAFYEEKSGPKVYYMQRYETWLSVDAAKVCFVGEKLAGIVQTRTYSAWYSTNCKQTVRNTILTKNLWSAKLTKLQLQTCICWKCTFHGKKDCHLCCPPKDVLHFMQ